MTLPHRVRDADPLAPVTATLRAMFGTDALPALAPGLLVADEAGWRPATELTSGDRLDELLDAAKQQWGAAPHAAAALAWKSYTYWLALPPVLGWASARRVPLLDPDSVLFRFDGPGRLLTFGLRRTMPVAVLPTDPLALAGSRAVRVVADEAALLTVFRESLLDAHLTPLLGAIQTRVRIGARTLLGSVSSCVAHAILRAADVLPGSSAEHIGTLLDALGVEDLIDLVPDASGQLTVQRKTCCLAFTLPQPKICTGCCIKP
ncbi:IucA/IucC family C-terminal-domain containing protein [Actinomycetes bacterium KLBMP 9797]